MPKNINLFLYISKLHIIHDYGLSSCMLSDYDRFAATEVVLESNKNQK